MSVNSVDAEHAFSQYKLNNQHESLTPKNTKQLTILNYYKDFKTFKDC